MTRLRFLAPVLAGLLILTACSSGDEAEKDTPTKATVLAAASLTEVLGRMAADLKAQDSIETTFSFGSSTTLAEQAGQGAPGDLLATADKTSMDLAVSNGAVTADPTLFATNRLVLVTPADNPGKVDSVDDLDATDWVRCADDVPCGRLALTLLEGKAKQTGNPASLEVDVKSVLAKVTSGEADAGLVYATDAAAAGDQVQVVEIPGADEHLNTYWVAPLATGDARAAEGWMNLIVSERGKKALTEAGFGLP